MKSRWIYAGREGDLALTSQARFTLTCDDVRMSAELTAVIYDGECDFCIASLGWLRMKLDVKAISFHEGNLEKYGLTKAECEKEVIVLHQGRRYSGADAIALLLSLRGNRLLSGFIRALGPISRFGYRWIAGHRGSWIVKAMTKFFLWQTNRHNG